MINHKYIVLDEHTLGIIYPNGIQILQTSTTLGSPHPNIGLIAIPTDKNRIRPATLEDFKNFNVNPPPESI